jgi:hypothetical protein
MYLLLARVPDGSSIEALPQRTSKHLQNIIRFERFQIGLLPGKFDIILHADRHYPVVPANTQK